VEAGVIDEATAGRIRAFEQAAAAAPGSAWPVRAALIFGGLLLAAGVLLFVAAHWDRLSPGARFALVTATVGAIHGAAAFVSTRSPALATTLHGVGTVSCGGAIFLAGQIFNLEEHWPAGFLLWAGAAAAGWGLRRDQPQLALLALLTPVWLVGEWFWRAGSGGAWYETTRIAALGVLLLSLSYLSAARSHQATPRRLLAVLGAAALLPACLAFAVATSHNPPATGSALTLGVRLVGWTIAIGVPIALAVLLRGREAWPVGLATAWALVLLLLKPLDVGAIPLYGWWALGAVGVVGWGVRDARLERVNLGFALFAATVLAFYFSNVMTRLGRSASLITLGFVFLAGGWALERSRRQIVRTVKEARS
jgi:uncharacterized membrane protein